MKYACDIAYDCPLEALATPMMTYNVTMRILEAVGPGGGNPYVEFEADTRTLMFDFLKECNLDYE